MNIKKILKFYFVIVLILTVFASVSYNDEFKRYMSTYTTSVLGYKYNEPKPYVATYDTRVFAKSASLKNTYYKGNPYGLVFNISSDASMSMVASGTQRAGIMTLNFKALNEAQVLKNLTFKIVGAEGNDIKSAYLMSDEKIISTASISNQYVSFLNIAYKIEKNGLASVMVVLDLAENFKIGNRFRLDIENPEDIDMEVNGNLFSANGYYPMRGEYLTISKTVVQKK